MPKTAQDTRLCKSILVWMKKIILNFLSFQQNLSQENYTLHCDVCRRHELFRCALDFGTPVDAHPEWVLYADDNGAPTTGVLKNGLITLWKITLQNASVIKPFFKTPVFGAPLSSYNLVLIQNYTKNWISRVSVLFIYFVIWCKTRLWLFR